jgi:glucose/arabinose dehydrogenase
MRLTRLAALAAVVTAAACAGPAGKVAATNAAGAASATIAPSSVTVSFTKIASGLTDPVFVTSARDGSHRLFIVEKSGTVRVFRNGVVLSTAYLDLTPEVNSSGGEQGLLGIAFHPDFTSHPFLYAAYTVSDGSLRVSRFRAAKASANTVSRSTEVHILTVPHTQAQNHNGGQLLFDRNGLFYITTGDGGSQGDPWGNAENLTKLNGKVLRIDVNRSCGSHHYCIPSGNPFPHATNADKRLVFDWGLRNPWRASIDRGDGTLWIGDVGQDTYEEIDHTGIRSKDFGWSCREAYATYNTSRCSGRHMTNPVTAYSHGSRDTRCAVIGGYAYHGPTYPFAHGLYLFGDYCSGQVWALGRTSSGGYRRAQVGSVSGGLAGFGEGGSGEIYAVTLAGALYHVRFHRV